MSLSAPEREATSPAVDDGDRVLVFTIGEATYALPVDSVLEIVGHRNTTPVPGGARAVEGVVPVRGRMVTFLDVRRCLALPPRPPGCAPKVIVVGPKDDCLGLVVDDVTGVARPSSPIPLLDIGALLRGLS